MTEDNILDENDLDDCFKAFKQDVVLNKKIYLSNKDKLVLRFHQELIVRKTSALIGKNNKSFLWGCKCRSGKTYMLGGIIVEQLRTKKKLNVLIVTPAPTETLPQFTEDLFYKFGDFDAFSVHCLGDPARIEVGKNNIFVASKQLLQQYVDKKTIACIRDLKLDIISFDENHFGGTTELSKSILASYSSKHTVKIYLTATYYKPLRQWSIPPEC